MIRSSNDQEFGIWIQDPCPDESDGPGGGEGDSGVDGSRVDSRLDQSDGPDGAGGASGASEVGGADGSRIDSRLNP